MTCDQCRWCEDGRCRRYPPRPVTQDRSRSGVEASLWPMVAVDDWCGEWTPRPLDGPPELAVDPIMYTSEAAVPVREPRLTRPRTRTRQARRMNTSGTFPQLTKPGTKIGTKKGGTGKGGRKGG